MKKTLFAVLICCTVFSCQKDKIEVQEVITQKEEDQYFDLHGLQARVPEGIDPKWFKVSEEDFIATLGQGQNMRISGKDADWSKINNKKLISLIEKEMKKLPDMTKFKDGKDDWGKFKKDFPGIKSYAELETKGDIVSDYYSIIVRQRILPEVEKMINSSSSSLKPSEGNTNALESFYSITNPVASYSINCARNDIDGFTFNVIGNDEGNSNLNAAKHASWNAIAIQEMMLRLMSKNNACEKTTMFMTAHEAQVTECQGCPDPINTLKSFRKLQWFIGNYSFSYYHPIAQTDQWWTIEHDHAMDLHNNMVGRTYMKENASFWNNPDDIVIIRYFYKKACKDQEISREGPFSIYNRHSGNTNGEKLSSLLGKEYFPSLSNTILVYYGNKYTKDKNGNELSNL